MKIYTRTGDDGTSALFGGQRVRKSDPRLECCGTIDELNAALGLAVVVSPADLAEPLRRIQEALFVVGAHLGTPPGSPATANLPPVDQAMISRLEEQIDAAEAHLSPLRQFILPGGTEAAARLHLARTICRRAERALATLALDQPVAPVLLQYLNRLSDWLFMMARLANHLANVDDTPWRKPQP